MIEPEVRRCPHHAPPTIENLQPVDGSSPNRFDHREGRANWLVVPGDYAHPLSLSPLSEAKRFNFELGDYFRQKQASVNQAPVFKLHAGLRTIAFSDHRSGQFYFEAPRSVLEREPEQRFGFIALQESLTGGCHPALVSSGEQHDRSRALTDAILAHRGSAFVPALERVCERIFAHWESKKSFELFVALQDFTSAFAFEWLLEQRPDPGDIIAWQSHITTIVTDTRASTIAGRVIFPRPSAAAKSAAHNLAALARRSSLYGDYRELARKCGIDESELANFLVFLCSFNGSGAVTHSLFPSLTQLSINDAVREELLAELGRDLHGLATIDGLPLLDAIHSECVRLYTRPRLFYKKAMVDLGLPTNDGRVYGIHKGDLLVAVMPILHRDPTVFRSPDEFAPRRFLEDPSLKGRVWGYGTALGSQNPYGCAAHKSGHAQLLWKAVLSRLVGQYSWDLMQEPDFNINHFFEVAPLGLAVTNFTRRGIGSRNVGEYNLTARFRRATATVRALKVSFDRPTYLRLYGLYKQSLEGDNDRPRPGALQATARLKWDAWNILRGVGRTEAMTEYTSIVEARQESLSQQAPALPASQPTEVDSGTDVVLPCTVDAPATEDQGQGIRDYRLRFELVLPASACDVGLVLVLVGSDGQTPPLRCNLQQLQKGATPGTALRRAVALRFGARCVGRPYLIRLGLEGGTGSGDCLVETILVSIPEVGTSFRFLGYEHVPIPSKDKLFFESSGTIARGVSAGMAEAFGRELAQRKAQYRWKAVDGYELPAHVDIVDYEELPRDERFHSKHEWVSLSVLGTLPEQEERVRSDNEEDLVASHKSHFEGREARPRVLEADLWRSDEEFGRALLHGSHCTYVRRCRVLPDGFEPLVAELSETLASGNLYIADYAILEGITPYPGRYLAAPTVLLRADPNRRCLIPVAIRVTRDADAPIFTPEDSETDWLIAKFWARLADVSVQQICSHYLECHAVIEAMAVAVQHNLPSAHPVYQLLAPHLKHAIAINVLARKYLISEGGLIDSMMSIGGPGKFQLMERSYRQLSLADTLYLPRDLQERKVDGDDCLDYHYRDDARMIWAATSSYVARIVEIFYRSDEDVQGDHYLQGWLEEFNTTGYPRSDLPRSFETRAALSDLLTAVIFTASAKHATHNYMQYESYAFSLFTPATLCAPPPRAKGQSNVATLGELLPPSGVVKRVIESVTLLSMRFSEDLSLASDPHVLFGDPDARMAVAQFRDALKRIESVLSARNKVRAVSYDILMPSRIPNGVVL